MATICAPPRRDSAEAAGAAVIAKVHNQLVVLGCFHHGGALSEAFRTAYALVGWRPWEFSQSIRHSAGFGFGFVQPDSRPFRVRESAKPNLAPGGHAISTERLSWMIQKSSKARCVNPGLSAHSPSASYRNSVRYLGANASALAFNAACAMGSSFGGAVVRVATGTPTSIKNSSCPAGQQRHNSRAGCVEAFLNW